MVSLWAVEAGAGGLVPAPAGSGSAEAQGKTQLEAQAAHDGVGRAQLALRRHVVHRAQDQADRRVAERGQVPDGLLDGDLVVAVDPREGQLLDRGVDEDDRQVAPGEPLVVPVRRVPLRVVAAGEHDPGHLLPEHLQSCIEPLVRSQPFPLTQLSQRDRVTYVIKRF